MKAGVAVGVGLAVGVALGGGRVGVAEGSGVSLGRGVVTVGRRGEAVAVGSDLQALTNKTANKADGTRLARVAVFISIRSPFMDN